MLIGVPLSKQEKPHDGRKNMNQFLVRKEMEITFPYKNINLYFAEEDIVKGKSKLSNNFSKIIKIWDSNLNSEWVVRNYLAVKMIMSSTVMLTSLSYAKSKNLRITEPYLVYYSLLNVCRAVLFTSPIVEWEGGDVMKTQHSKIINIVGDIIKQFNINEGKNIQEILERARDYRELFSYKFPAKGIGDFSVLYDEAVNVCSFLAELAQLQSEILENKIFKRSNIETELNTNILDKAYIYQGKRYEFLDNEDWSRLNYISRKQPFPVSLYFTLSEGMVENYFGAWYDDSDEEENNIDKYNPDDNWQLIFPMP